MLTVRKLLEIGLPDRVLKNSMNTVLRDITKIWSEDIRGDSIILYSDEYTRKFELEGKWVDCVKYLHKKWTAERKNVPLFLKLSVNVWYTLTLDGPELSLAKCEYDTLTDMLCNCFEYFNATFYANENCQWLFGYMMEVRTDLFLNLGLEYDTIEQRGKALIEKASNKENLFAQLLFALDNFSDNVIESRRKKVREHILEYFDDSQEIDRYFIEILTAAIG